jgi:flagellar biosynthetic protein FliP
MKGDISMTTETKTTQAHIHTASIPAQDHKIRSSAAKVGRFILHFLEMLMAMMVGMPFFFMVRNQVPGSSIYAAAFVPGTNLHDVAMVVFMVVPMVIWMIVRGHGWHHSAEMAFAMSVPGAVAICLRLLGVGGSQLWLVGVSHLGMLLGMLTAMLYRRDHYTGKAHHLAPITH